MQQGLLIVDVQNDYFPKGAMELVGMEKAAANCRTLLEYFRTQTVPVFHLQHLSTHPGATFFLPETHGSRIHESVAPMVDEPVVAKHFPSGFRETTLHTLLQQAEVSALVICGAMSHMCIDTTVRAAFDLEYSCTVIADACATRDLTFEGQVVSARDVHAAFMGALSAPFAEVTNTARFIDG